jgi:hypothetical protein
MSTHPYQKRAKLNLLEDLEPVFLKPTLYGPKTSLDSTYWIHPGDNKNVHLTWMTSMGLTCWLVIFSSLNHELCVLARKTSSLAHFTKGQLLRLYITLKELEGGAAWWRWGLLPPRVAEFDKNEFHAPTRTLPKSSFLKTANNEKRLTQNMRAQRNIRVHVSPPLIGQMKRIHTQPWAILVWFPQFMNGPT